MHQAFNLQELKTPEDYISEGRTHIFPSEASLLWFIRKNRSLLLQASALFCPTGRTLINSPQFDHVVITVGTNALRSKAHATVSTETKELNRGAK